jgi:hypothetical protein
LAASQIRGLHERIDKAQVALDKLKQTPGEDLEVLNTKGQLPALPIYFQNQDRIEGLMFLLTLALRVFTLIEFVVRQAISASKQKLAGLYDGNPKRTTERPSAEQLLRAFDNLTLYFLPDTSIFVTTLSALHRQILLLLRLPDSIYSLHLKPRKT